MGWRGARCGTAACTSKGPPMTQPTHEHVREEVLKVHQRWLDVHREWFELDRDASKTRLREVFPVGEQLNMFNADGSTYRSVDAIINYWEALAHVMEIVERPRDLDLHVTVTDQLVCVATRLSFKTKVGGTV